MVTVMRSISDIIPPLSTSYFIILCRQMRRARDERDDVRDNLRNIIESVALNYHTRYQRIRSLESAEGEFRSSLVDHPKEAEKDGPHLATQKAAASSLMCGAPYLARTPTFFRPADRSAPKAWAVSSLNRVEALRKPKLGSHAWSVNQHCWLTDQ